MSRAENACCISPYSTIHYVVEDMFCLAGANPNGSQPQMLNVLKTAQAAAVLIRAECATGMNYMRVLKLLYIADRECLRRYGRVITGDRAVATKRGPVLSVSLDLIKGEHPHARDLQQVFE